MIHENRSTTRRSPGPGIAASVAGALLLLGVVGCDPKPSDSVVISDAAQTAESPAISPPPTPVSPATIMAVQSSTPRPSLSAVASPAGATALVVAANTFVAIPATAEAEKRGTIKLKWNPSPDVSVTGYRVYFAISGSDSWQSANAGLSTSALIRGLNEGTSYQFQVVAYDKFSLESEPSNQVQASTSFYISISVERWSVSAFGATGKTNQIQMATNLTNWVTLLTWVGTGRETNISRPNKAAEYFRVEAK